MVNITLGKVLIHSSFTDFRLAVALVELLKCCIFLLWLYLPSVQGSRPLVAQSKFRSVC